MVDAGLLFGPSLWQFMTKKIRGDAFWCVFFSNATCSKSLIGEWLRTVTKTVKGFKSLHPLTLFLFR